MILGVSVKISACLEKKAAWQQFSGYCDAVRSTAYEEVPGMTEWAKIMLVIFVEGRKDWEQKGKREAT